MPFGDVLVPHKNSNIVHWDALNVSKLGRPRSEVLLKNQCLRILFLESNQYCLLLLVVLIVCLHCFSSKNVFAVRRLLHVGVLLQSSKGRIVP